MELATMRLDVADGIGHLVLTQSEALNRMGSAFWADLAAVFAEIDRRADVRAVLLTSTGAHFSAGLDLEWAGALLDVSGLDPARGRDRLRRRIIALQQAVTTIEDCRAPVIAVVQGGCIGAALDLVAACDLRVGVADCFFTIHEINLAIVADLGALQRLPRLMPAGVVRELALTGRRMMAAEAESRGFLNRIAVDADAAVAAGLTLARDIAARSPLAVAGVKAVLNHARDHDVASGLDYVAAWNAAMLPGGDVPSALAAQKARQAPIFDDLAPL